MPPTSTLTPTQQLYRELSRLGYTPTQIGSALLPTASANTRYRLGHRLELGHALDLDRAATLARELGIVVTLGPAGLQIMPLDGVTD